MKATVSCLGSLLLLGAAASSGHAQGYYPYPYRTPPFPSIYGPVAPDACGPGHYCTNACGTVYGPSYCLQPGFPPYNGERPCLNRNGGGAGSPMFPSHPYVRSPRDFFMMD